MIILSDVLTLAAILFCISVAGIFLNRKNVLILLMCIELMLLSVNMNFIAFSHFLADIHGQVFVFFILTVAAAASAICSPPLAPPPAPLTLEERLTALETLHQPGGAHL